MLGLLLLSQVLVYKYVGRCRLSLMWQQLLLDVLLDMLRLLSCHCLDCITLPSMQKPYKASGSLKCNN